MAQGLAVWQPLRVLLRAWSLSSVRVEVLSATLLLLLLVRKESRVELRWTTEACSSCGRLASQSAVCCTVRTHAIHHRHIHTTAQHIASHHHAASHWHLHAASHVVHSHSATRTSIVHSSAHPAAHHIASAKAAPKVPSIHHGAATKVLHSILTTVATHLTAHVTTRTLVAHPAPVIEAASVVEIASVVEAIEVSAASSGLLVVAALVTGWHVLRKRLEGVVLRRVEDGRRLLGGRLVFEELFDLVLQGSGGLRRLKLNVHLATTESA